MASEWEFAMGFGSGMGIGPTTVVSPLGNAPHHQATMNSPPPAYLYGLPSTDSLRIDDLLDLSNHEVFSSSAAAAAATTMNIHSHNHIIPKQESGVPFVGESGSSHSSLSSFADDIYIPREEAAELEWLSNFVEDSFSDIPYPSNYLSTTNNQQTMVGPTTAAPGRGARSKRSRAAPPTSSSSTSSSSSSDFPPPANISGGGRKKGVSASEPANEVRRCTHCASEKTPQWRTGPLGPKTLCNACGVRYKSGRLVPEYRPAASPTFVLTQHSNSHRKVMELRRQKEQLHVLHHDPSPAARAARPEIIYHAS